MVARNTARDWHNFARLIRTANVWQRFTAPDNRVSKTRQ